MASIAPLVDHEKWKAPNEESLGLIRVSMVTELCVLIENCTKAYEAWVISESTYDTSNISNKIQLRDQLKDLKYTDFKAMDDFLSKFDSLNSQLNDLKVNLDSICLIHIILKKVSS